MSPQPSVPFDLQKYIGSSLISQHPRNSKKGRQTETTEFGNNCRTRRISGGISVPVCTCCGGVQIQKPNFSRFQNYAWTGMPLISVAKGHTRKQQQQSSKIKFQRWPSNFTDTEYNQKQTLTGSSAVKCNSIDKETTEEELSSMSKLALHAQGSPLILSNEHKEKGENKGNSNTGSNTMKGKHFYIGNELYLHPQYHWATNDARLAGISGTCSENIQFDLRSTPVAVDETGSVSGESDVKSETDLNDPTPPQQSDSLSITSDSSGSSENSLPRIIKPRKRRKRDRKMNEFKDQNVSVILTLKPYQPLCFPYTEGVNKTGKNFIHRNTFPGLCYSSESEHELESVFGSLTMTQSSLYPYSSSPLCSCKRCITLSPFLTPPLSPLGSPEELTEKSSQEPICEVSTRIVTSPCGSRDLEIKFLTISNTNNRKNGSEHRLENPSTSNLTSDTSHFHSLELDAPLPPRSWMTSRTASSREDIPKCTFTVMSYNILCPKYANQQIYTYCPSWALDWEYRRKAIMDDIRHYFADIITLQEVETEQFYEFFLPELRRDGYEGIFSPKSRAKIVSHNERRHVDGCAIFFRINKFTFIKENLVEFNQVALATAEGSDDMLNRVQTRDNIGLVALLQPRVGPMSNDNSTSSHFHQPLLVCTTHMHWDPAYSDVKLIQTMMLMHELRQIAQDTAQNNYGSGHGSGASTIPLLLCGDFNSIPSSGVVEFLTTGKVSADHSDFKGFGYKDCLQKLGSSKTLNEYSHPFQISRAYKDGDIPYTNLTNDFKGVIDYIFYPDKHMRVVGLLGPLDEHWLKKNNVAGCPHPLIPSDHLPLLVELEMICMPQKFNSDPWFRNEEQRQARHQPKSK
ncbi:uncharacterized protein LOC106478664 [Limulus polyphemus]|uniref:Uncharacterized protein LOC106478664 n=1 Tax=Limulus polyphemus TaxID=6850 RepID=A0ABM1C5P1_LIMPO|nr:uncharacterized protein LOC106478664 [Limulus polyphemus]